MERAKQLREERKQGSVFKSIGEQSLLKNHGADGYNNRSQYPNSATTATSSSIGFKYASPTREGPGAT